MPDKPILFSAPMVRALLDGRKTQTRRVFKAKHGLGAPMNLKEHGIGDYSGLHEDPGSWGWPCAEDGCDMAISAWPEFYPYAPGDRLWVREAIDRTSEPGDVFYRADYEAAHGDSTGLGWKPSIHMPRWASRLTLTVTDVRVQRLQDISEADAVAEGILKYTGPNDDGANNPRAYKDYYKHAAPGMWLNPRGSFGSLWESINGPDAWDANPWVVALTFAVHRCNIDKMPHA